MAGFNPMKRLITDDRERVSKWVAERVNYRGDYTNRASIGLEQDGELIAGILIDSYVRGARCSMHCAGEGRRWLNREFLFACFDFAFRQLDCKVIINTVDSDNEASLRFTEHIGFSEVARIPEGGGDCDLVIFAMQRKTCRWLNMKRG